MIALKITEQGMDTNTTIFLSVYFVCITAIAIAFILRKRR